jgi:hypothetical protein
MIYEVKLIVLSNVTLLTESILGWTLNANIQTHIDVYLSAATFTEVQRAFPYLVFKEFASGGGDVWALF